MSRSLPETVHAQLARCALEEYVRKGKRLQAPSGLPDEFRQQAGCFVSLKENGLLRGCIGTVEPVESCLAEEIITNAVSAGTRDPRFFPVDEEELSRIVYSVDVLSTPEPIESLVGQNPKVSGLIVESRGRRGLLLPDLPQVTSAEQQLAICLEKAGLGQGDPIRLYRFTVTRYR